ncbi:MAG: hypothetical protein IJA65_04190, partial [Acholeplasmatales bacterium]|nr:hypothetical protein [Acholeplasmatales bacterium]
YLLCSIGNSEMGLLIKSMLKKFNIHIIDISSEYNNISNISSIYVNTENGDRTILSGQHKFKIPAQLSLKDIVKKCKFVLYDGNLNGIENELLQCVECYDKELVLDAGSYKTGFPECFYHATTVISSEGYKDLNGCDVFDLQKSYDYKYAAKTRGKNSILYMEDGTIKEMDVVDVKTIDTLGAGDILHGAYCFFRYVKKLDFKNSLKMASNIASFSTTKRGVIEGLKYAKNEFIDEIL